MFQVGFNVVGCAVLVPLFYLEVYGGVQTIINCIWVPERLHMSNLEYLCVFFQFPRTFIPFVKQVAMMTPTYPLDIP